jgi:hypothetical protein
MILPPPRCFALRDLFGCFDPMLWVRCFATWRNLTADLPSSSPEGQNVSPRAASLLSSNQLANA